MRRAVLPLTILASTVVIGVAAVGFSHPAQAVAQQDADKLQAILTRNVSDIAAQLKASGGELRQTGSVTAKAMGDYIQASYPDLTIVYPGGNSADMGAIALNAKPGTTPGQWLMSFALPMPMITYDKTGAESGRMTAGSQKLSGVYDEKAAIYTSSIAELGGVQFNTPKGANIANINRMAFQHQLTPKAGGVVDISSTFGIEGVTYPDKLSEAVSVIPLMPTQMQMDITAQNFPQEEAASFNQKIKNATTPEARAALARQVNQLYQKHGTSFHIDQMTLSGADYKMNFSGDVVADPSAKGGYVMNGLLKINGLQALQAKLMSAPAKTDKEKQALMKTAAFLVLAQGYLQQGSGDNFTLKINIDRAGRIMVNDVDRTADLGRILASKMQQGGAAGTAPAAKNRAPVM